MTKNRITFDVKVGEDEIDVVAFNIPRKKIGKHIKELIRDIAEMYHTSITNVIVSNYIISES